MKRQADGGCRPLFVEVMRKKEEIPQLETRMVLVCDLAHPQFASGAMRTLSQELPLGDFDLLHLKRIRNSAATKMKTVGGVKPCSLSHLTIVLGPPESWAALPANTRDAWAAKHGLVLPPRAIVVPARAPSTRMEHDAYQMAQAEWNKSNLTTSGGIDDGADGSFWPINYHPIMNVATGVFSNALPSPMDAPSASPSSLQAPSSFSLPQSSKQTAHRTAEERMLWHLWEALADQRHAVALHRAALAIAGTQGSKGQSDADDRQHPRGSISRCNGGGCVRNGTSCRGVIGAVLVDPSLGRVVICASRVREELRRREWERCRVGGKGAQDAYYGVCHPLLSAPMLCVKGMGWKLRHDRLKRDTTPVAAAVGGRRASIDDRSHAGARCQNGSPKWRQIRLPAQYRTLRDFKFVKRPRRVNGAGRTHDVEGSCCGDNVEKDGHQCNDRNHARDYDDGDGVNSYGATEFENESLLATLRSVPWECLQCGHRPGLRLGYGTAKQQTMGGWEAGAPVLRGVEEEAGGREVESGASNAVVGRDGMGRDEAHLCTGLDLYVVVSCGSENDGKNEGGGGGGGGEGGGGGGWKCDCGDLISAMDAMALVHSRIRSVVFARRCIATADAPVSSTGGESSQSTVVPDAPEYGVAGPSGAACNPGAARARRTRCCSGWKDVGIHGIPFLNHNYPVYELQAPQKGAEHSGTGLIETELAEFWSELSKFP